ncbi:hypothetical protein SDC9_72884 [bioreactor metagenome]|uniref:Uncharacterized protein n=1 Tax=bioreactor metagenome TaxID=1076179 RepID=A0A644YIR6_9ZZZZ
MLEIGDRLVVDKIADQVAVDAEHGSYRQHEHDGGGARNVEDLLPGRAAHIDIERHGHGDGERGLLFGQHGRHVADNGGGEPTDTTTFQSAHVGEAREHRKQRGHENGALNQITHHIHSNWIEREDNQADAKGRIAR